MLLVFTISLVVSVLPVRGAVVPLFSDVSSHWAKASIEQAVTKGYVSGYPDGKFLPDKQVTRAEFIKMVVDALKLPHVQAGSPWYQKYVAASIEFNIHKETDFKELDLNKKYNQTLTRMEMARIAVRAVDEAMRDPKAIINDDSFMLQATTKGIIHGMGKGELAPEGLSTRAQAVAVVERMLTLHEGKTLPTDQTAIDNARIKLTKNNLFLFGFTDIVTFPVTVVDPSGYKITIHSMYAYDTEGSKPIVEKYEFTEYAKIGDGYGDVPIYEWDFFDGGYTMFLLNITIQNDGKKDVAKDFYDNEPKYNMVSMGGGVRPTPSNSDSELRKFINNTEYTYGYRIKPGESLNTNQAFTFKTGSISEAFQFATDNASVDIATVPDGGI